MIPGTWYLVLDTCTRYQHQQTAGSVLSVYQASGMMNGNYILVAHVAAAAAVAVIVKV